MICQGVFGICGVMLLLTFDATSQQASRNRERVVLTGEVLLLTEALASLAIPADSDPIARQCVLRDQEGEIVPLLLDEASRALFTDSRLRRRPVRIEANRWTGLPYLQVLRFQVWEGDRYRTPEYWCDVCSISWLYDPDLCPCCQGPMVLRMKPDDQ
jgi:hypothetical protein